MNQDHTPIIPEQAELQHRFEIKILGRNVLLLIMFSHSLVSLTLFQIPYLDFEPTRGHG